MADSPFPSSKQDESSQRETRRNIFNRRLSIKALEISTGAIEALTEIKNDAPRARRNFLSDEKYHMVPNEEFFNALEKNKKELYIEVVIVGWACVIIFSILGSMLAALFAYYDVNFIVRGIVSSCIIFLVISGVRIFSVVPPKEFDIDSYLMDNPKPIKNIRIMICVATGIACICFGAFSLIIPPYIGSLAFISGAWILYDIVLIWKDKKEKEEKLIWGDEIEKDKELISEELEKSEKGLREAANAEKEMKNKVGRDKVDKPSEIGIDKSIAERNENGRSSEHEIEEYDIRYSRYVDSRMTKNEGEDYGSTEDVKESSIYLFFSKTKKQDFKNNDSFFMKGEKESYDGDTFFSWDPKSDKDGIQIQYKDIDMLLDLNFSAYKNPGITSLGRGIKIKLSKEFNEPTDKSANFSFGIENSRSKRLREAEILLGSVTEIFRRYPKDLHSFEESQGHILTQFTGEIGDKDFHSFSEDHLFKSCFSIFQPKVKYFVSHSWVDKDTENKYCDLSVGGIVSVFHNEFSENKGRTCSGRICKINDDGTFDIKLAENKRAKILRSKSESEIYPISMKAKKNYLFREFFFEKEKENKSENYYWIDQFCMDQRNTERLNNSIASLPINIVSCQKLLVVLSESYLQRLWCLWDLFFLIAFCNEELISDKIEFIVLCNNESTKVDFLDQLISKVQGDFKELLDQARCFDPNEQLKMRNLLKQSMSDENKFEEYKNQIVDILTKEKEKLMSLTENSVEHTSTISSKFSELSRSICDRFNYHQSNTSDDSKIKASNVVDKGSKSNYKIDASAQYINGSIRITFKLNTSFLIVICSSSYWYFCFATNRNSFCDLSLQYIYQSDILCQLPHATEGVIVPYYITIGLLGLVISVIALYKYWKTYEDDFVILKNKFIGYFGSKEEATHGLEVINSDVQISLSIEDLTKNDDVDARRSKSVINGDRKLPVHLPEKPTNIFDVEALTSTSRGDNSADNSPSPSSKNARTKGTELLYDLIDIFILYIALDWLSIGLIKQYRPGDVFLVSSDYIFYYFFSACALMPYIIVFYWTREKTFKRLGNFIYEHIQNVRINAALVACEVKAYKDKKDKTFFLKRSSPLVCMQPPSDNKEMMEYVFENSDISCVFPTEDVGSKSKKFTNFTIKSLPTKGKLYRRCKEGSSTVDKEVVVDDIIEMSDSSTNNKLSLVFKYDGSIGKGIGESDLLSFRILKKFHDPFSKLGIKLSYFDEFISKECGGSQALIGMTTTEVCEMFVKPATLGFQTSFCDMMIKQGHPSVGAASVFISHAWKYKLLDVVSALKSHFKKQPDIIVWFDLFSNNQHKAVDLDFGCWCEVFMSAISDFRHVVMILSPWGDPISLTRAWCLFEAYCSAKTKCRFEVALGAEEKKSFFEAIMDDADKHVNNMIGKIDCEKSECFKPEDRAKIFDVVRREVGFGTINSMVFEQLRDWVVAATKEELEDSQLALSSNACISVAGSSCGKVSDEENHHLKLQSALGDLFLLQGKYDEAEPLLRHCFDTRVAKLGLDDISTLKSEFNLAELYRRKGRYAESEPLHKHCFETRKLMLGEEHDDTLRSMNLLGLLFEDKGEYSKAEPLYERCLDIRRSKHGEDHEKTLMSMNNLASLYTRQKRYSEAKRHFKKFVDLYTGKLGEQHPDTLTHLNCLASLYDNLQKYSEAEPIYKKVLDLRVIKLGEKHPDTLISRNNLGAFYVKRRRYIEAEPELKECLKLRIDILGEDHPHTETTNFWLKRCQTEMLDLPLWLPCAKLFY